MINMMHPGAHRIIYQIGFLICKRRFGIFQKLFQQISERLEVYFQQALHFSHRVQKVKTSIWKYVECRTVSRDWRQAMLGWDDYEPDRYKKVRKQSIENHEK